MVGRTPAQRFHCYLLFVRVGVCVRVIGFSAVACRYLLADTFYFKEFGGVSAMVGGWREGGVLWENVILLPR